MTKNNEMYVGSTFDLRKRIVLHNFGKVFSTELYKPRCLVAYEAYQSEKDARGRERRLKAHGNAIQEWKKRARNSFVNFNTKEVLPSTTILNKNMKEFIQHHFSSKKNGAGFTIIELIVSVAIIAIITAVVMFNQNNLSEQISLTNLVSDMSLRVRQAQVYGISVKEFNPSASNSSFLYAYGVDFNIGNANSSNAGFFTFADQNADGYYDGVSTWNSPPTCTPSATSECVTWNAFTRGNVISKLCAIQLNGTSDCSPGTTVKRMAITFLRPSPVAKISFFDSSGNPLYVNNYQAGEIVINSPHGLTQTIVVWTTGQISVVAQPY